MSKLFLRFYILVYIITSIPKKGGIIVKYVAIFMICLFLLYGGIGATQPNGKLSYESAMIGMATLLEDLGHIPNITRDILTMDEAIDFVARMPVE